MWEKWGLNQWFCSCKKSFKFFEKLFFKKKKKIFHLIFADMICQVVYRNFCKINESWNIWVSVILRFWKLFFIIKLLIKIDQQKDKKILHTILLAIISLIILQNFCKTGLNPEEFIWTNTLFQSKIFF